MKRETLGTLVAATLFLIGMSGLFLGWHYTTQERAKLQQQKPITLPVDPNFKPIATRKLSFEARAKLTKKSETPLEAFIQHDGKGTIRVETKQDNEFVEYYLTPEKQILCQDSKCYGTKPIPDDPLFDVSSFIYSEEDLGEIGRGLILSATQPCGERMCELWSAPTPSEIIAPQLLLDLETHRIIRITGIEKDTYVDISFDYKDVKIILPLQVEDLSEDQSTSGP